MRLSVSEYDTLAEYAGSVGKRPSEIVRAFIGKLGEKLTGKVVSQPANTPVARNIVTKNNDTVDNDSKHWSEEAFPGG